MTLLTFTKAADENEVFVGTVEDVIAHGLNAGAQTFTTEQDLFVALQPIREQEKIVTCLSDLQEFKTLWQQKWMQTAQTVLTTKTATERV